MSSLCWSCSGSKCPAALRSRDHQRKSDFCSTGVQIKSFCDFMYVKPCDKDIKMKKRENVNSRNSYRPNTNIASLVRVCLLKF